MLKILMIGDIVGRPGRNILEKKLPLLINKHKPDLIIANGENAAGGRGITEEITGAFFNLGIDIITMGNHTWDNRDIYNFIDSTPNLIRPANYPENTPGRGWVVYEIRPGLRPIAVINLMGRAFMNPLDCPFHKADLLLEEIAKEYPQGKRPLIIVDFHAEATSEKAALAFHLAGRVTAVLGTHTHVQTADERVLEGGTAFITDVGMTGPLESVLGIKPEIMIHKFLTQMPVRHELAGGQNLLSAVLIEADELKGTALSIQRIKEISD